jgi:hypothetical protein
MHERSLCREWLIRFCSLTSTTHFFKSAAPVRPTDFRGAGRKRVWSRFVAASLFVRLLIAPATISGGACSSLRSSFRYRSPETTTLCEFVFSAIPPDCCESFHKSDSLTRVRLSAGPPIAQVIGPDLITVSLGLTKINIRSYLQNNNIEHTHNPNRTNNLAGGTMTAKSWHIYFVSRFSFGCPGR